MNAMNSLQSSSMTIKEGSNAISQDQKNAKSEIEDVGGVVVRIDQAVGQIRTALEEIAGLMSHLQSEIQESTSRSQRLQNSVVELTGKVT